MARVWILTCTALPVARIARLAHTEVAPDHILTVRVWITCVGVQITLIDIYRDKANTSKIN